MPLPRSTLLKTLIATTASITAALLLADLATTALKTTGCDSSAPLPLTSAIELDSAIRELISLGWLAAGHRAIFVGPDAAGAATIARRKGLPETVAAPATACCALPFDAESFDFAFSASLDRARVPARVVLEMERVLKPGRVGAIFRMRRVSGPEGLMKAAAPVASLLRFSDVIGVRALNGSAIVAFRKRGHGGRGYGDGGCGEGKMLMSRIVSDLIESLHGLGLLWENTGRPVMVTEMIAGLHVD